MGKICRWLKQRQLWLEYGFLSLLVMLPLLRPGYILTLDMVFTPRLPLPAEVTSSFLFNAALHYLNYLVPSQVIQKLLLFGVLVLAGAGAHRLMERTRPAEGEAQQWGAYFAGILYMINPFTYQRFMDGHYAVLLGYALLPWFAGQLFALLGDRAGGSQLKPALRMAGWAVVISIVSLHTIGLMVLLSAVAVGLALWRYRRQPRRLMSLAWSGALVVGVVLVASSYWLWPLVRGGTGQTQLIANFDQRHLLSFRTEGDTVGVPLNSLALYGYWGEREDRYILPKEQVAIWPVLAAVIGGLVLLGIWQARRWEAVCLTLGGLLAWVLAMGIAWPPVAGLNLWLLEHVPFFQGYREPQKFLALLALAYAYLGALGIKGLQGRVKDARWSGALVSGFLVLPLLYTPTMLWGFASQLQPRDYPADWYALNRRLNQDSDDFQVLFLPWHQYLSFGFADRLIVNPAPRFFDQLVIAGDNAEIGLIERQVTSPTTESIERMVLDQAPAITDAGARLAGLRVKYVVLAKELDWQVYAWLDAQPDLELVSETATLRLYRNTKFPEAD